MEPVLSVVYCKGLFEIYPYSKLTLTTFYHTLILIKKLVETAIIVFNSFAFFA